MIRDPLDTLVQDAPDTLAPGKDLWPGIERRLARPIPERQRPVWASQAASWLLALLIGTGLGAGGQAWWMQSSQQQAGLQMLDMLASQHQQRRQQHQAYQWSLTTAGKEAAEDKDLTTLRQAGEELLQALKQDPFNPALLELWLWVQQREIELLDSPAQRRLQPL